MRLQRLLDNTPARLAGRTSDLLQLAVLVFTLLAALCSAGIASAVWHHISMTVVVVAAAISAALMPGAAALTYYVRCIYFPQDFVIEELDGLLVIIRVQEPERDQASVDSSTPRQTRALAEVR